MIYIKHCEINFLNITKIDVSLGYSLFLSKLSFFSSINFVKIWDHFDLYSGTFSDF